MNENSQTVQISLRKMSDCAAESSKRESRQEDFFPGQEEFLPGQEESLQSAAGCLVCGEDADGFGSFPIAGGRLCGGCAAKLSEWFRCSPDTTPEEIREQLAFREENRTAFAAFHTTKLLWPSPRVAVDVPHGTFFITREEGTNPDILAFQQILGCELDLEERRRELFRPGRTPYRPRRYEYRFEFFLRVLVEHPYFHEMRFRLHDRPIVVSDRNVHTSVTGKVVRDMEYQRVKKAGEGICQALRKAMEQARKQKDTGEQEQKPVQEQE